MLSYARKEHLSSHLMSKIDNQDIRNQNIYEVYKVRKQRGLNLNIDQTIVLVLLFVYR